MSLSSFRNIYTGRGYVFLTYRYNTLSLIIFLLRSNRRSKWSAGIIIQPRSLKCVTYLIYWNNGVKDSPITFVMRTAGKLSHLLISAADALWSRCLYLESEVPDWGVLRLASRSLAPNLQSLYDKAPWALFASAPKRLTLYPAIGSSIEIL